MINLADDNVLYARCVSHDYYLIEFLTEFVLTSSGLKMLNFLVEVETVSIAATIYFYVEG